MAPETRCSLHVTKSTEFEYRTWVSYLVLRVEIDSTLPIKPNIPKHTALVTAPRKHGQRNRNRDVDANLWRGDDIDLECDSFYIFGQQ